jgi:hypothetical protein
LGVTVASTAAGPTANLRGARHAGAASERTSNKFSSSGRGFDSGAGGFGSAGIGFGSAGIGFGSAGIGFGSAGIGFGCGCGSSIGSRRISGFGSTASGCLGAVTGSRRPGTWGIVSRGVSTGAGVAAASAPGLTAGSGSPCGFNDSSLGPGTAERGGDTGPASRVPET